MGSVLYDRINEEQEKEYKVQEELCKRKWGEDVIVDHRPPVYNTTTQTYMCPAYWDTIYCWPTTHGNTLAEIGCPSYVMGFKTEYNATRYCYPNGTWFSKKFNSWTNYTECTPGEYATIIRNVTQISISDKLEATVQGIKVMSQTGYAVSLLSLIIAFGIMFLIKKLHCARNILHMNLFASFILRAFIIILKSILFQEGLGTPDDFTDINGRRYFNYKVQTNNYKCKILTTFVQYFTTANHSWILMEGLYLNNLIFRALFADSNKNILNYILLGWESLTTKLSWSRREIWQILHSKEHLDIQEQISVVSETLLKKQRHLLQIEPHSEEILMQNLYKMKSKLKNAKHNKKFFVDNNKSWLDTIIHITVTAVTQKYPQMLSHANNAIDKGLPLMVVIPWVVAKLKLEDEFCWTSQNSYIPFYIIVVPTMVSCIINFVLFIIISIVLYSKLRSPINEESRRYQKWAKSTLVLVPLFGVHYFIFLIFYFFRDIDDTLEVIWLIADRLFGSFQGFFVAVLYCFLNGEVKAELKPYVRSLLTFMSSNKYLSICIPCKKKYLRSAVGRTSVCTTMSCSSLYTNGLMHHRNSKSKLSEEPHKLKTGLSGSDKPKPHICGNRIIKGNQTTLNSQLQEQSILFNPKHSIETPIMHESRITKTIPEQLTIEEEISMLTKNH